jgi:hypothetical protein
VRFASASQGTTRQDPADGVGAKAVMLKRSPAIDFAEHRTELRRRGIEPVT